MNSPLSSQGTPTKQAPEVLSPSRQLRYPDDLPELGPNEVELFIPAPLQFAKLQSVKSARKTVGSFTFRILAFPAGNTHNSQSVALYVECVPRDDQDERWFYSGVKFQLTQINFADLRKSIYRADIHSFSKGSIDRGWPDFADIKEMKSSSGGWLDDQGRMLIRASCTTKQADTIIIPQDYNSRSETGYTGLRNHGATCYLNGLLQSLFHIGKFREIVYGVDPAAHPSLPLTDDVPQSPSGEPLSLPVALQSVFLSLQNSDAAVACRDLIKAFGWDSMDAFTQHDAQELQRILCDRLEASLKRTRMDGELARLLEGKVENFVECLDMPYRSVREEAFYDIPLSVRGLTNQSLGSLEAALSEFTASEILEGENAYEAEGHGKQRARKGTRFLKFPPVLNFQLKRFHFDLERLELVKLNDRFTFPPTLDLTQYGAGVYRLHTVLVHTGDINSGHYYAFIRPTLENKWFRFDDETVTRTTTFAAVDDNFGGEDIPPFDYLHDFSAKPRARMHSAYMLVYVAESAAEEVLQTPEAKEAELKQETRRKGGSEVFKIRAEGKEVTIKKDQTVEDLAAAFGVEECAFFAPRKNADLDSWIFLAPGCALRHFIFSAVETVLILPLPRDLPAGAVPVLACVRSFACNQLTQLGYFLPPCTAPLGPALAAWAAERGCENACEIWEEVQNLDLRLIDPQTPLNSAACVNLILCPAASSQSLRAHFENSRCAMKVTVRVRDAAEPLAALLEESEQSICIDADSRWPMSLLKEKVEVEDFIFCETPRDPEIPNTALLREFAVSGEWSVTALKVKPGNLYCRVFDDHLREQICLVLPAPPSTAAGLVGAARSAAPQFFAAKKFRVIGVSRSSIVHILREDDALPAVTRAANPAMGAWRVEPDDGEGEDTCVCLCERGSLNPFGLPFVLRITPGTKANQVRAAAHAKVGGGARWRLMQGGRALRDEDEVIPGAALTLEYAVSSGGVKALTIR